MSKDFTVSASLDDFASGKLQALDTKNQRRTLVNTHRSKDMALSIEGGPQLISFSDNDYLGLSTNPDVIAAAQDASAKYGAGTGASRLVTGNCPLYSELEAAIARVKNTEDAVVFGSGYMANIGIIPALIGPKDLILADELVHTCIHGGITLSRATCHFFRHNDVNHAKELLRKHRHDYDRVLIVVDGIYSMDGDFAPLKELGQLAKVYDAWLMNDDAHALGTVGGGRGSAHALNALKYVPLQMGTLSKAVGSYGGYLAASKPVVDLMKTRARSVIYTTGLPPSVLAASIKALEIIESNAALTEKPLKYAQKFADALGLAKPSSPIVPLIIGGEIETLNTSAHLAEEGYKVIAIRPPTVAVGTSRLRFSFSATHKEEDIESLIRVCKKLGLGA